MNIKTNDEINNILYKNPHVPFINLAGSGVPFKLAWIFDKWGMWNPHIIVSAKDTVVESDYEIITQLRAMERTDELWDVVEFKGIFLPTDRLRDTFLNTVHGEETQTVIHSSLTRDDAADIILRFNASIAEKTVIYDYGMPPHG
jgi:hypothetical protein